jgi:hypothetical protein
MAATIVSQRRSRVTGCHSPCGRRAARGAAPAAPDRDKRVRMHWDSHAGFAAIVWLASCSSETPGGDGDSDGDPSGGTGSGGVAGSATNGGTGAGSGAGRGGGASGAPVTGGTSAGTPATGGVSGGAGAAGAATTGGQSGSSAGGSGTGGGTGVPWSCEILAANGNCYCGRTAEPAELTTCPAGMWPCCVYFTGEAQGVVIEACACEGIPAAECDTVAERLQNGMRVTNCPP